MTTNASEALLNALDERDREVARFVLQTEYNSAGREIVRLIQGLNPDLIICLGVSEGDTDLRFERVARNWDGAAFADNAGDLRTGQIIDPLGPDAYPATLGYEAITAALNEHEIVHTFSDDAGGYVCNHVFFQALHEIAKSGRHTPCGFIHVPPIRSSKEFHFLLSAIQVCIKAADFTKTT
jgi:pyroglutamyl-peptidase